MTGQGNSSAESIRFWPGIFFGINIRVTGGARHSLSVMGQEILKSFYCDAVALEGGVLACLLGREKV